MTNRERFINTVLCKEIDRPPFFFYFGPWVETIKRWRIEGLEPGKKWFDDFGFDAGIVTANVNLGYFPAIEERIIEDKGDTVIKIDSRGILLEDRKDGGSIPRFIDYPVKTPEDWEKLKKERLNPDDAGRFPDNWDELVNKYNNEDKVVQLGTYPYGLFGTLRDMMGVEELLVSFYEQPELIKDMMNYLTDFWIYLYEKVCKNVKVDCIHIWEDMSGKQGSLISPRMVREFMLPNYRKIKAFAERNGIPVISLDTDGNCSELVPLFMESGINLILPFEVAAGSDIVDYRRKYPNLGIMGGIDKQEIAKGKEAIDKELERISGMFTHSGFIPALDHLIHPEISWEDFKYFVFKLKEYIGL
jgi:uroporphyrinogen decarboxylase